MFKGLFRKSLLKANSVSEKECLKSLTVEELEKLSSEFQENRRNYLHVYLQCLEHQFSYSLPEYALVHLKKEKAFIWKSFLHYNDLVAWVEGERGVRK